MKKYDDSLRGYSYAVHQRDGWKCVYCGWDGSASFENWVFLSRDHLLPKGDPKREDPDYIVTACRFCNEVKQAPSKNVVGKTKEEIIKQNKVHILERREEYRDFWEREVKGKP